MATTTRHIVIIAGEASGDMHAAHLVRELKRQDPGLTFSGLGGARMQAEGVELYADLTRLAVVGFVEVLKHYTEFRRLFNLVLEKITTKQAEAVILVDYPGFNLRLAKAIKPLGIKTIYYISPQVWAWKARRVEQVRAYTDKMLVLFPFEQEFYRQRGVEVDLVGHPLVDSVAINRTRADLTARFRLDPRQPTIGLLPGSRVKEIESLLPIMLKAVEDIRAKIPGAQFLLIKAPTIEPKLIDNFLKQRHLPVQVVSEDHYDGIQACDYCLVASGTATLETALLQKPMVVVYKTSLLTWLLAKALVKIPDIGLVNVVAGKRVVPECVQFDATPGKISKELLSLINDPDKTRKILTELVTVRALLGQPGASRRAAEVVMTCLPKR